MMHPRIAIVADDLTGAADTAAGMLGIGQPRVTWAHDGTIDWDGHDRIVAVDATTRHATADVAAATVRGLAARFRAGGFDCLYKKIDSTLKGHVAVEVTAALDGWHPRSLAVIAPAFPAMGRTTIGGRQFLGDAQLDPPPIAGMLAAMAMPVTAVPLGEVRGGNLAPLFQTRSSQGGAVVCDATTDGDLAAIAAAGATLGERVVWVGSGGLARNMFLDRQSTAKRSTASWPAASGPVLIVCGSQSIVCAAQAVRVEDEGAKRVVVRAGALAASSSGLRPAIAEIEHRLRAGEDVLVTIERESAATDAADPELVDRLGWMLAPCKELVGGLVATGGDTASAILRHWEINALQLLAEAEPGVPVGIAEGATAVIIALKAGSFGSAATLAAACAAVRSLVQCGRK
jgi:4-hydroxythreonine-4-phosphate dehydrogenase